MCELSQINGYNGAATTTLSLTMTSGNLNVTGTDVSWTASGGNIVPHYAVIKNDTTGGLVAYSMLDSSDTSVTCLDTKQLTIDISTNSIYDETRQTNPA